MNKKILALLLAFAMVFSTVTVAFADEATAIGADAQALKTIGVLQGENSNGVTPEYLAKETTRMQAAIMYLRLSGLEDEAMAFTGTTNFADADTMKWAEGKAIMAYLKANPQLGWVGADGGNFVPFETITAQQYYKVMLEALGYKQGTDFEWTGVMAFAATKGLTKVANVEKFTNNDLAIATIEGLKANVKDTATTLAAKMVDAGMINKDAAIAAGLYAGKTAVAVKSAKALGNSAVEVTFAADVDAAAGNVASYSIEGLAVNTATVSGADTVILGTAAQTAGKLYTLTVGEKAVKFAGIAKVSGGPELTDSKSEDVEEVVLTFDKNLDFATATNVANYSIAGVQIAKAEVDGNEVTLTTVGLKDNTSYTVKVSNIKSIDGVARKSASDNFRSNYDTAYPRIDSTNTEIQTNQRIILHFNEDVTKESAENVANYSIKVNETNGEALEVISATQDPDNENEVAIITEPMVKNENYKLSVSNIADQRKVANVMTRPATFTFKGLAEDKNAPQLKDVTVISKNLLLVEFNDNSRIDEASATDINNYTFTKGSETLDVDSISTLKNENGVFKALVTVSDMDATKNYDLKVVDVVDEFGNGMKEDSESVDPTLADFASAKLTGVAVNSKSQITLTFDKDLVEATAENIANYSFDGGIGTPIKAEYEKNNVAKTVTLTLNELTNGVKYDLTVNGVTDLAGNVLSFTKKDILAVAGTNWDNDKPVLEDAYAVNKYVAALQFDEAVTFEPGTELWLTVADSVYNESNPIKLTAKALTDDDTVVEFSNLGFEMDDTVNYSVYKVVYGAGNELGAIKDKVGNAFTTSEDEFTFDGSNDDVEYAEVDSYNQINGGTFEVTMSKNVDFYLGAGTDVTVTGDVYTVDDAAGNTFVATIDDNVVKFVGTIKENGEYDFDLTKILVDEHGMAVTNADDSNSTILVGEETDVDAPYITSVNAADRLNVKITFSEDIKTALTGNFKLKNVDTDKNVTITGIDIDDNVVTLTVSPNSAFEGRYGYELTMSGNVVADFAGNKAEADSYSFDGSDLSPLN